MNRCCKQVIEPSLKLGKMIVFLKIVNIIHLIIINIDLFVIKIYFIFLMITQLIFILIGIYTKYFAHFLLFILICIFNFYKIVKYLVIWAQIGFYQNNKYIQFCFSVFLLAFEIFCIFIGFQLYKQTKQEFRIKFGFSSFENEGNINIQEINNNNYRGNNNYNDEYIPIRGDGLLSEGNQ